ncbi:MAG: DUF485 domain-containing protein [Actinobacteria bacterium]|jgi:Protein of unknown function, DUF485.|nr:DUF485 domain-containing protein [Actinomycetota bacterium]
MLHEPAAHSSAPDEAAAYKRRLGLINVAVYGAVYLVFMILNVASPKTMGLILVGGLNVAIVYGFALIILAFIMAIIYNLACGRHEKEIERGGEI